MCQKTGYLYDHNAEKLINETEKYKELNKIITSFKLKLQERRKIPVEVIKLMLQYVKESRE